MNTKRTLFHMTLGAYILGLSVLGSQKNPVARPFKASGHGIAVITLNQVGIPVSVVTTVIGQASHFGLVTGGLNATFDENGVPIGVSTLVAANGDQIFALEGQVGVITGGTGRFEGATGSVEDSELIFGPPMLDPINGTITQEFTFRREGTIVY